MENHETFKKKVIALCQAFSKSIERIQDCLLKIVKALLKIGKKEVKKQKHQASFSPFTIWTCLVENRIIFAKKRVYE